MQPTTFPSTNLKWESTVTLVKIQEVTAHATRICAEIPQGIISGDNSRLIMDASNWEYCMIPYWCFPTRISAETTEEIISHEISFLRMVEIRREYVVMPYWCLPQGAGKNTVPKPISLLISLLLPRLFGMRAGRSNALNGVCLDTALRCRN